MVQLLWKAVWWFLKKLNQEIQQFHFWVIHKRIESRVSKRYLYTHIHSTIIYSSQKAETTQVSINGQMDKQNVVQPYNGILFNHTKEYYSATNTTTWKNLEDIMLSEISQFQKDRYCMISLRFTSTAVSPSSSLFFGGGVHAVWLVGSFLLFGSQFSHPLNGDDNPTLRGVFGRITETA